MSSANRTGFLRRIVGTVAGLASLLLVVPVATLISSDGLAQDRLISFERGRTNAIRVARGQFVTTRTAVEIGRLVVGDPAIAQAVPTTERSFYILGKAEGRTNVAVHDPSDSVIGLIDVEVGADAPDLAATIRDAVPSARVQVETVNGRLRLAGTVPDAIALRRVLEIAEQYVDPRNRNANTPGVINALRVTGGQQVLLEVRFIEVERTAGRELGVSWAVLGQRIGVSTGAFRPPSSDRGVEYESATPFPGSSNAPFGTLIARILSNGVTADVLVQALETKGLARRLAEPNLVALSGDTASFLAGGEFPYTIQTENGPQTLFKQFGIQLNFAPTVLDNGLIHLKLRPEVSEIASVSQEGVPTLSTRRAETTVQIRDGQSFAIAGLLQARQRKDQEQLPWLGQVPVLGALFRSASFQEDESDLVIIVTPRLAQPSPPGRPLRTPLDEAKGSNDVEFFLLGTLEIDEKTIARFYEGGGIMGPYGHIIDLPPLKPRVKGKVHVVKKH